MKEDLEDPGILAQGRGYNNKRVKGQPAPPPGSPPDRNGQNDTTAGVLVRELTEAEALPHGRLTPAALLPLIERGDVSALLHEWSAARLPELEQEVRRPRRGIVPWIYRMLFGAPPSRSTTQKVTTGLNELRDLCTEASEVVAASNTLIKVRTEAGLQVATTERRYNIECEKLDAEAATHRLKRTTLEAKIRDEESRSQLREEASEIIATVRAQAAREIAAAKAAAAAELQSLQAHYTERGRMIRNLMDQVGRLQATEARLETQYQQACRNYDEQVRYSTQLAEQVAALQREVAALREPATQRERAREHQLEEERHRLELSRLQAEKDSHRRKANEHRNERRVNDELTKRRIAGARDPETARRQRAERTHRRELERISEEVHAIKNQGARESYAQNEMDAYVSRMRDEHGEGSEEHQAAIDLTDQLMRKLRDGEES